MFPTDQELTAGAKAYNRFIEELWRSKQGELEARAAKAAKELIEENDRIKDIQELVLRFGDPPVMILERIDPDHIKIGFKIPARNGWGVSFKARVRKSLPFSGDWHTVGVEIKGLRLGASMVVDHGYPTRIWFNKSETDVALGDLKIKSSNAGLNVLGGLLSPILEEAARQLMKDALPSSIPNLDQVTRIKMHRLADRPIYLPKKEPDLKALQAEAEKTSDEIQQRHTPFGTVLDAVMAKDSTESDPVDFVHYGDSAIWTGHYLAAEVLRLKVSKSAVALKYAHRALDGLEALINLTGEPGHLSRVMAPVDSPIAASLEKEAHETNHTERLFTGVWRGKKYLSLGHITRDQYAGAFLGTGLAALLLVEDEPELAERARAIALQMTDYLVKRHFCPTEATPDPVTGTKLTSVTYLANPVQMQAILQLAKKLDPAKYADLYEDQYPTWAVNWFFSWTQILDPHDSYFKFNLEHALGLLLLMLEDDAERRAKLAFAFRIQREALKFHANAWFNEIELATLGDRPELLGRPRQDLEKETRRLVADMLERPAIMARPDFEGDPFIQPVYYLNLSSDAVKEKEKISRLPIPLKRRPGADFLWQRSPFDLESAWPLPKTAVWRSPGVDKVLVYWFARYLDL